MTTSLQKESTMSNPNEIKYFLLSLMTMALVSGLIAETAVRVTGVAV